MVFAITKKSIDFVMHFPTKDNHQPQCGASLVEEEHDEGKIKESSLGTDNCGISESHANPWDRLHR